LFIVNSHVKVPLDQDQFDALVDFCFNAGIGAFYGSTLLKLLNQGNYDAIPEELKKWNKCHIDGVLTVVQGLVNRRNNEILLWEGKL
jgi:lysozyme